MLYYMYLLLILSLLLRSSPCGRFYETGVNRRGYRVDPEEESNTNEPWSK